MNEKENKKNKIIKQAFQLIESNGWKNFSITKLSKEKQIDIKILKLYFKNRYDFLKYFSKMIDEEVISEIDVEEFKDNSVKDNLFELVMLRFEKLEEFKNCLKVLIKEIRNQPKELKTILCSLMNSFELFITISSGKKRDFFDFLKINALFLIYIKSFQVWLNDNSKEMSATMAEVDKWLSQSEKFLLNLKKII